MFEMEIERHQSALPKGQLPQLALAWEPEAIDLIQPPEKNMLVYFWEPSVAFRLALAEGNLSGLPELRVSFKKDELLDFFIQDHGLLLNTLFKELKTCIDQVIRLGFGKEFQLTLGRPTNRMCPLFHVDNVSLRLFVTLKGPGTEWLADSDVNRKALGRGDNDKILRPGAMIQQLKTFQVAIMKGEEYPGCYGRGLVHRSPSLMPTDSERWFFRLDCRRLLRKS